VLELIAALADDGEPSLEGWLARLAEAFAADRAELIWPATESHVHLTHDRAGAAVQPCPVGSLADRLGESRSGTTTVGGADGACWLAAWVRLAGGVPAVLGVARKNDWLSVDRLALGVAGQSLGRSDLLLERLNAALPQRDQVRLANRLRDAATVSGRVAHDFDNLLTGILGFAELSLASLSPGSTPHQYVSELLRVGQQGTRITQQLHQFSRSGASRPHPGPVAQVFRVEAERVRPALGPGRTVRLELADNLPPAGLDGDGLRQVVGHFLDNACEALPSTGGTVTVSGRAVELSAEEARGFLGQVGAGPHLEITLSDTGPGIPPDIQRRLLAEPFFSTKPRHRGLGLVVCYRILAANKGGFTITSRSGSGTTVRVVVPVATSPSFPTAPRGPHQ
jgi:signal transduction histidine kinase